MTPPLSQPGAPPPLVIGGGLLGSAIARQLHAARATPLVCSRTPRAHPGLWCSIRDLRLQPQQQVWIAVGPGPSESGEAVWGSFLSDLLSRLLDANATVLCCGPLPAVTRACADLAAFDKAIQKSPVPVLRLPPLFGNTSPLRAALTALRAGETVWIDRDLPPIRPLWVEDAARAALLRHTGTLQGPDAFTPDALLDLLATGTPGRWRRRWPFPSPTARRARAQQAAETPWPDGLPAPLPFKNWLGQLPEKPSRR